MLQVRVGAGAGQCSQIVACDGWIQSARGLPPVGHAVVVGVPSGRSGDGGDDGIAADLRLRIDDRAGPVDDVVNDARVDSVAHVGRARAGEDLRVRGRRGVGRQRRIGEWCGGLRVRAGEHRPAGVRAVADGVLIGVD